MLVYICVMRKLPLYLLLIVVAWGCGDKEKEECVQQPDISSVDVHVKIEQFQDSFVNISSKAKLVKLLTHQPFIRDHIFRRSEYPNDSVFINQLYRRFNSPSIDTLLIETKRVFGDLTELATQFEQAFAHVKYYYPGFTPPKVQTVISGLDNDLLVTDSVVIVSLDFFLGPGAKYRPNVYEYVLRQYQKQNIVPSCMLIYGISNRFNKTNLNDKTVLADMIAYGKSFYFAKHMLPCTPDSVFIWYTPEEIEGSRKNQDLIWARLVQDQVLYSTSHMVKQKYLGERPKTLEVGEKCPGRIAQWIGWQIINQYMQSHPDTSIPQMMGLDNAQDIFKNSGYRPGKP